MNKLKKIQLVEPNYSLFEKFMQNGAMINKELVKKIDVLLKKFPEELARCKRDPLHFYNTHMKAKGERAITKQWYEAYKKLLRQSKLFKDLKFIEDGKPGNNLTVIEKN